MMKIRNRVIIGLMIIGISLFGLVQGVIIPRINHEKKQYTIAQQDPKTNDLNNILKYKNKYMGNISNVANMFSQLPLNDIPRTYELFPDKLEAQLNYKEAIESISEKRLNEALIYNSTAAFALIDNLQVINYNFTDGKYLVLRVDVEKWYGEVLLKLLKKEEWKNKVQSKLADEEYIKNCTKAVIKRQ